MKRQIRRPLPKHSSFNFWEDWLCIASCADLWFAWCVLRCALWPLRPAAPGLVTVADWKFNSAVGNGLTDSSGHGYTLTNNGAVTFGSDPNFGTYATFSGGNYLSTSSPLALSTASEVIITYSLQATDPGTAGGLGIVLETSDSYSNHLGALAIADSPSSTGVADLEATNSINSSFPNSPIGNWDTYQIVFNANADGITSQQITDYKLESGTFVPVGSSVPPLVQGAVFANFDAFLGAGMGARLRLSATSRN